MGILKKTIGSEPIYNDTQILTAEIFHLLGHPGRTRTILLLVQYKDLSLGEIREYLQLSQSATSALVKQLKDIRLIRGKEVGTSVQYSLNTEMWENMKWMMQYFLDEVNSF